MNITVIQALDQAGKRWFWNRYGAWQEKRDADCHITHPITARKAYQAATVRDRFNPADERMAEIEMVELL